MFPKVIIILVNYNGYKDTIECVESLLKIKYPNYQILIVENGSKDQKYIREDFFLNKYVKILISDTNLGFSGANNIGIKYALSHEADYILLLNNDTIVTPEFLNKLVQCAVKNSAAITTGNIAYYWDRKKLWYSGGRYDYETGSTYMNWCEREGNMLMPREVSFSTGCLMLISSKYIKKYGALSDDYFMYSEDTDFCCRAIKNNEKIVWNPQALIYHKVSSAAKDGSKFQQYYMTRNCLYIVQKYGTRKEKAYMIRIVKTLIEIAKGKQNIVPLIDALIDFKKGIKGRSVKY